MVNLDTPSKRRVWILPIQNGAITSPDWVHIGLGYSGITISAPSGVTVPGYLWNKSGWF